MTGFTNFCEGFVAKGSIPSPAEFQKQIAGLIHDLSPVVGQIAPGGARGERMLMELQPPKNKELYRHYWADAVSGLIALRSLLANSGAPEVAKVDELLRAARTYRVSYDMGDDYAFVTDANEFPNRRNDIPPASSYGNMYRITPSNVSELRAWVGNFLDEWPELNHDLSIKFRMIEFMQRIAASPDGSGFVSTILKDPLEATSWLVAIDYLQEQGEDEDVCVSMRKFVNKYLMTNQPKKVNGMFHWEK